MPIDTLGRYFPEDAPTTIVVSGGTTTMTATWGTAVWIQTAVVSGGTTTLSGWVRQ